MDIDAQQAISFAEFELDTAHRRLLREGTIVPLYAKTFDLLLFLVQHRGEIVSKEQILNAVWADQFVEEANLSVQISAIRKALGEKKNEPRFLLTIPGVGYKFIADFNEPNQDIIIEKHKISRVVIEEREIEMQEPKGDLQGYWASRIKPRLIWFVLAVLALGALWGGISKFFPRKNQAPAFGKIKIARLTNNGRVIRAAASDDNRFLAYVLSENEGNSIWVRQLDAANDLRIVSPINAEFWELTFTPDGRYIYYNLFYADKTDPELYRIPALGGVSQRIKNVVSNGISFSPDGKKIAYIQPDSPAGLNYLIIADAEGTNQQIIAEKKQPDTFVFDGDFVAWSPDGEMIACLVNHQETEANYGSIVAVNLRDKSEKTLGTVRWREILDFDWLRDGSGLIISGSLQTASKNQIWFFQPQTDELTNLTDDPNEYSQISSGEDSGGLIALQTSNVNSLSLGEKNKEEFKFKFKKLTSEVGSLHPISWTASEKIIYRSLADNTPNLWSIDLDGMNRQQLTNNLQMDARGMCATPDGKYLVFTSRRSGKSNIWRIKTDGTELVQLTTGEADAYPSCLPGADSVIFQRGILSQPTLWQILLNTGVESPVADFRAKWSAVSNDGKNISFFQMENDKWQISLMNSQSREIWRRINVPEILREEKIQWSLGDQSLYFIGRKGNVGNIWELPFDGSPLKMITNFDAEVIADFSFSPDQKKLAVVRTQTLSDIVLITGEKK